MTVLELCEHCEKTESCRDCHYTYVCRIFEEEIKHIEPWEVNDFMKKELNK